MYNRIKIRAIEELKRRGSRSILVDTKDLIQLIEDYEKLNEIVKENYIFRNDCHSRDHFVSLVKCEFHKHKEDYGRIFITISEIIKPLIKEREQFSKWKKEYGDI